MPQIKKKKRPIKKTKGKKPLRTGKLLTATIYAYVEENNAKHAVAQGKRKLFGTTSAYINALIARDRGVKPVGGTKGQRLGERNAKAKFKLSQKSSSPVRLSANRMLRKIRRRMLAARKTTRPTTHRAHA